MPHPHAGLHPTPGRRAVSHACPGPVHGRAACLQTAAATAGSRGGWAAARGGWRAAGAAGSQCRLAGGPAPCRARRAPRVSGSGRAAAPAPGLGGELDRDGGPTPAGCGAAGGARLPAGEGGFAGVAAGGRPSTPERTVVLTSGRTSAVMPRPTSTAGGGRRDRPANRTAPRPRERRHEAVGQAQRLPGLEALAHERRQLLVEHLRHSPRPSSRWRRRPDAPGPPA